MKIIKIHPVNLGGNTLARFTAEIADGVTAYDLRLVKAWNGLRVFGPSIRGGSAVTFSPDVADELAALAWEHVAHNENQDAY